MRTGNFMRWSVRLYLLGMVWLVVALEVAALVAKVDRTMTLPGKVVAKTEAAVLAPIDGRVTEVLVRDGQLVEQGDVLLRFELEPLRRRLEGLKRQLASHEAEVQLLRAEREAVRAQWDRRLDEAQGEFWSEAVSHLRSRLVATRLEWENARKELETEAELAALERDKLRSEFEAKAPLAGNVLQKLTVDALQRDLEVAEARVRLHARRLDRLDAARSVAVQELEAELKAQERNVELVRTNRMARLAAEREVELQRLDTALQAQERTREELTLRIIDEQRHLRDGEVVAPWRATVLVMTEPGLSVQKDAKLLALVTTGDLRFRTLVPEEHVAEVRRGQPCVIKLEAFPYMRFGAFAGRVEEIAVHPEIHDGRSMLQVDLRLDDPRSPAAPGEDERYLMPNLTGTAEVTLQRDVPFLVVLLRGLYRL